MADRSAAGPAPLPPLDGGPAPSNVDRVAEALRSALAAGRFQPGDRIKEAPIAAQLGMSRGPVRDALRVLQEEGLLSLKPNVGAVVPEITALDVLEVYALRAAIGSVALRKLTEDPDPSARVRSSYEAVLAAGARAIEEEFTEADLAFQDAIVRASGLERAATFFERLTLQVKMFVATLHVTYCDRRDIIIAEDSAIFDGLNRGDVAAADRAWREKFQRWTSDFTSRLEALGGEPGLWLQPAGGTAAQRPDGPGAGAR